MPAYAAYATGKNKKKYEKLVFVIFLIVGIVMIAVGVIAEAVQSHVISKSEPVAAVIDRIERFGHGDDSDNTVWVGYEYNGTSYSVSLNYYSSSMREGQALTVYVSPDRPDRPYYKNHLLGGIFAGLGLLFSLLGGMFLLWLRRSRKLRQRVKTDGRPLNAQVLRVEYNTHYRVNGVSPYRVICQYTDPVSGASYSFHSENLWFDPKPYLGDTLRVYVQEGNYKVYCVDTEALEAQTHPQPTWEER